MQGVRHWLYILFTPVQSWQYSISFQSISSLSKEDTAESVPHPRRLLSICNTPDELCATLHSQRGPTVTFRYQLNAALQKINRHLHSSDLSHFKNHLIAHSGHDFSLVLSAYAGLGSNTCHLYRIVLCDKLHMVNLVITRIFCDLNNTVLQRDSIVSLSRLIAFPNGGYHSLSHT